MANLEYLLSKMNGLSAKIDELNSASQYLEYDDLSGMDIDYNDPNELLLKTELIGIMEKLNDVRSTLKYLNSSILSEGQIFLNSQNYYELKGKSGKVYHCGDIIEFKDPDNDCWALSYIGHNGNDYYIIGYQNLSLQCLRARNRKC
ncbi:MAG: DUF5348 domain-containing protein [Erysipelotrichaceae bacterium]|nr:DUF5348 domain-containing protein [Erysipelotrichaceae bacterium]